MPNEIERKFLVRGEFKPYATSAHTITQGYLCRSPLRCVRVRLIDDKAALTIKGPSSNDGLTRFEWEKSISPDDAHQLLQICEPGIIKKIRYRVPFQNHCFEVDEFDGNLKGLILAELELQNENEPFERPDWLGDEVTGDPKYYNAASSSLA